MAEILKAITEVARRQQTDQSMLARFFRLNAAAYHGVPWEEPDASPLQMQIVHEVVKKKQGESSAASIPVATSSPAATGDGKAASSWKSWILPALLAVIAGAGVAGGAYYLGSSGGGDEQPAAEQGQGETDKSGSLKQYLEDEGLNVPPESRLSG